MIPLVFALKLLDSEELKTTFDVPAKDTALASVSPVIEKFLAVCSAVAVSALPVTAPVIGPENDVAVMMPLAPVISIAEPSLRVLKVDIPVELILEVIRSGNLASLMVPVVILAPSERLVAVVAVPVNPPTNVDAVTIPDDALIPPELIVTAEPTTT